MTTISIRLDDNEKEAIQKYADENDLSMSQVVRRAIKEFMKLNENNDWEVNYNVKIKCKNYLLAQNTYGFVGIGIWV